MLLLPALHPTILMDSDLGMRCIPHSIQQPNVCGLGQKNSLNFSQFLKSATRLQSPPSSIMHLHAQERIASASPSISEPKQSAASGFKKISQITPLSTLHVSLCDAFETKLPTKGYFEPPDWEASSKDCVGSRSQRFSSAHVPANASE